MNKVLQNFDFPCRIMRLHVPRFGDDLECYSVRSIDLRDDPRGYMMAIWKRANTDARR